MEVKRNQSAGSGARMYSPTHGTSAYAYAPAAPKRQQPEAQPRESVRRVVRQKPRAKQRLSALTRFSLFISIIAMSAALLTVVFRYNDIAARYALVNDLRESITDTEQDIKSLNVMLECAVSIQEVQEAAREWGMDYPDASQYIPVGDPLPASAGGPVETGGANDTAQDDTQRDGIAPETETSELEIPKSETSDLETPESGDIGQSD